MKRRIFSLIAALCCMMIFALPASAARLYENCIGNCKLYDPDHVFTETEQEELNRLIRQTSDDADVYVAVYVLNGSERDMTKAGCMNYADDRYDELFNPKSGADSDGVLLVVNLDMSGSDTGRYLYISTSGMGQLYYFEQQNNPYCRCEQMMDHIVNYMPRGEEGDLNNAIRAFCNDVKNFAKSGAPYHAYTVDYSTGLFYYEKNGKLVSSKHLPLSYRMNIAAGTAIGLVACGLTMLITVLAIKSRYKFRKSLSASNYISDKETTFYQRDDMFIRTHTTKSYIDRSSSGGGGGGGGGGSSHSSSGGHSHSGGGRSF